MTLFKNDIKARDISIIIPVKDNQQGIDQFLKAFFKTHDPERYPKEIIIVDNDSSPVIYLNEAYKTKGLKLHLVTCKPPGPGAARNRGASIAQGQWLLFVDSDCIPTASMISGYLDQAFDVAVGYQGFVGALGQDLISKYYESQHIHYPPSINSLKKRAPQYLVTANALVLKEAFDQIEGFNETFIIAGGEDIDLAFRLKDLGTIHYAPDSIILHDFSDSFQGFIRRFIRYGKGLRLVKELHGGRRLPPPFTANKKTVIVNNFLVILQWMCMFWGYSLSPGSAPKTTKESSQ